MFGIASPQPSASFLTILGQQPRFFNLYTQVCFCFARNGRSSEDELLAMLTRGLDELVEKFPWLSGHTIIDCSEHESTHGVKIIGAGRPLRLVTKDLRLNPESPSMDDMVSLDFPSSMLNESDFCPVKTYNSLNDLPREEISVLLLQVTFVHGGLVLSFSGQHNVLDMVGQGQVMRLFKKACRASGFTGCELAWGNRDGGALIPLYDDAYQPGSELDFQLTRNRSTTRQEAFLKNAQLKPTTDNCRWVYFTMSSTQIDELKTSATKSFRVSYISTDDILSAMVWKSILRARMPHLPSGAKSTFARAVNVRPFLDIPTSYPGLLAIVTYTQSSVHQLLQEPLGEIASRLREAVDPETSNIEHLTRAYATVLSRSADTSMLSVSANLDLTTDVMLTSWIKTDCCDLDFGLGLGKPLTVRRPRYTCTESLVYFMPRARDESISILLCLKTDEISRLREDPEFSMYADFVG